MSPIYVNTSGVYQYITAEMFMFYFRVIRW